MKVYDEKKQATGEVINLKVCFGREISFFIGIIILISFVGS